MSPAFQSFGVGMYVLRSGERLIDCLRYKTDWLSCISLFYCFYSIQESAKCKQGYIKLCDDKKKEIKVTF